MAEPVPTSVVNVLSVVHWIVWPFALGTLVQVTVIRLASLPVAPAGAMLPRVGAAGKYGRVMVAIFEESCGPLAFTAATQ